MVSFHGVRSSARVLVGKTSYEIIGEVVRDQHDLVVRTTKGAHSRRSGWLGTTSTRLLRKCPCPVWLVKPESTPRFLRVLAAVEPRAVDEAHCDLNLRIMELASSMADDWGAERHVLHAWEVFGARVLKSRLSREEFAELEESRKLEVTSEFGKFLEPFDLSTADECVHLVSGSPDRVIPDQVDALGVDLIVMGTVARSGISGALMGNTAESVLDRIGCAVLAVKPSGSVTSLVARDEAGSPAEIKTPDLSRR